MKLLTKNGTVYENVEYFGPNQYDEQLFDFSIPGMQTMSINVDCLDCIMED